jgi:hypothetical protein
MRQWLTFVRGFCLLLVLGLAACIKLSPADEADTGAIFDQIHRGDFQSVESRLAPEVASAAADGQLRAAAVIPAAAPQSARTVGFNVVSQAGGAESATVTREYRYPTQVLVVVTGLRRPAGKPYQITEFRVQRISMAAIRSLDFSLVGKSPLHYILLIWAVLTPLVMIAALVALYRSTIRPKWLWTIFVIFGIGGLSLNWATGATALNVGVQLLGSGIVKYNAAFAPWILSVSFPLGAIIVLSRVLRPRPTPPSAEDAPVSASDPGAPDATTAGGT